MANTGDERTYTIKIEFADSPQNGARGENGVPTPNEAVPQENGAGSEQQAVDASKSNKNAALAMVQQMASKAANTALNNYGNITGDYITQQNIQTVISEAAAIGGAIALGPAGIALYATDKLLQAYNYYGNILRSERDSAFQRERVFASTERA